MQQLLILKGLPGSGKSTWAKTLMASTQNWKRVNRDDLRAMVDNSVWTQENEKHIIAVRDTLIRKFLKSGFNVICDDTNLRSAVFTDLCSIVENMGIACEVSEHVFDVSLDTCIARDLERTASVGKDVITNMYKRYIATNKQWNVERKQSFTPDIFIPAVYDLDLPPAIICDLDGTLALLNGRNPYDASTAESDAVNEPVAMVLAHFSNYILADLCLQADKTRAEFETLTALDQEYGVNSHDSNIDIDIHCDDTRDDITEALASLSDMNTDFSHNIIFVTGREEKYRAQTTAFLKNISENWGLFETPTQEFPILYMRSTGDFRPDHVIKKEICDKHIKNKYNVAFVLDDRNRVVRMWRRLGLTVFQVADGDF